MSLLAFVFCLLVGGFGANNELSTVLYRAMVAMAGTFVVAYVVGRMAKKMIEENVAAAVPEVDSAETAPRPENFTGNSGRESSGGDR